MPSPFGFCHIKGEGSCPLAPEHSCADALISDIRMPGINGMSLVKGLVKRRCHISRIALMSAYWTDELVFEAEKRGFKVFRKPFPHEQLISWLQTAKSLVRPGRVLVDLKDHFSLPEEEPAT